MARFISNSFQVPNAVVDELMAEMSGNALKCYLLITRKTTGWGKQIDKINIPQFIKFSGVKDKRTVYSALEELYVLGLIGAIKHNGKISEFFLITDSEKPVAKNVTSDNSCTKPVTKNATATSDKKCHSTKDTIKNNINNSSSGNANALQTSSKKHSFSDDDFKCAEWIFNKIKSRYPQAKEPNFNAWSNEIRLMRDRDKLTHKEICEVFKWANEDSFWSANILSVSKLREKWLQLTAKMEMGSHENNGGIDWNGKGWLGEISESACSF